MTMILQGIRHETLEFGISTKSSLHAMALLIMVSWVIQMVTGFMLLGLVSYSLNSQFDELMAMTTDGNFVWMLSILHMLGSNFTVLVIVAHAMKAISGFSQVHVGKFLLWVGAAGIFLVTLMTAFTGYVVVSGNMSFWAAVVILNLATVIPLIGDFIVNALLGSSILSDFGLSSFTTMHFLLAVLGTVLAVLHVNLIHKTYPGSSLHLLHDGSQDLSAMLSWDVTIILVLMMFYSSWSCWDLVHPDNWTSLNPLLTPPHIEPEIYFLWTFSIMKLHNGKLAGFMFFFSTSPVLIGPVMLVASWIALQQLSVMSAMFGETFLTN